MHSIQSLLKLKGERPISMVTCYDHPSAKIISESPIDIVLVGDSLGEVVYGLPNTTFVSMEMMLSHTAAVKRGLKDKHLLVDMPAKSYDTPLSALKNAKMLMKSGADSLKLEIPQRMVVETLVKENIPIMGHVGLTPQTNQNYKQQGKTKESADKIFRQALELEKWGCFSILLEAIPKNLAHNITLSLKVPSIGIAAGQFTDGQVLVWHDLLGLFKENKTYVKKELWLFEDIMRALKNYHHQVIDSKK